MLRRLLARVRASSDGPGPTDDRGDEEQEADSDAGIGVSDSEGMDGNEDEKQGDSGFLRSRLDASVLYAHGRGARASRTLEEAREEADRLEGARDARDR